MGAAVRGNVPELRFGGFFGAWEEKRLEDLAEVARGKFTPRPRNDPRYYGGNTPFVQTGDIASSGTFLTGYSQTLNELGVTVSKVFPKDTILMTIAANIGDVALTTFPVACPDSLVGICASHSVDVMWLFYKLSTRKNELSAYATQNAQANINLQVLRPLKIYSTQKEEQKKIAAFLGAVDDKLMALRRKRELLQEYKRGMMQKIFSRELRFKGDDGAGFPDWVESEFDTLASRVAKKFDPTKNTESFPCVEMDSLESGSGELLSTYNSSDQKSIKGVFESGDILFGKLRPNLRKYHRPVFSGVCSSEIWVLRGTKIRQNFLYYLVQTNRFNWACNKTSGSKMPRADWQFVGKTPFFVPQSRVEQQRIADFLSAIDSKIEAVAGQVEQVETVKKGLLQKMFV